MAWYTPKGCIPCRMFACDNCTISEKLIILYKNMSYTQAATAPRVRAQPTWLGIMPKQAKLTNSSIWHPQALSASIAHSPQNQI
jgi:hypothetical protein